MAKNGQSAALSLSENQKQVIISGLLGDGYVHTTNSNSTYYVTNCKLIRGGVQRLSKNGVGSKRN